MKCECGNTAKWVYMPATQPENPYYCDECVSRGCTCGIEYVSGSTESIENGYSEEPPSLDNQRKWTWIVKDVSWCYVDALGRKLPCVEYDPIEL